MSDRSFSRLIVSIIGVFALIAGGILYSWVSNLSTVAQRGETVKIPVTFGMDVVLDHDVLFTCGYIADEKVFACLPYGALEHRSTENTPALDLSHPPQEEITL